MTARSVLLKIVFLSIGFSVQGFAQKYNIKTYSVNDGLPSSYVYDVEIDELGIVWFATADGLVKYDGEVYEVFDSKNGLKDDLIYDIFKDSRGNFWVSTELGGVAKFSGDNLSYIEELAAIDSVLINYIYESPDENLWFGSNDNGVYIWDTQSNEITNITTEDGLTSDQIWDFYFDEEGKAWISTMSGITIYDPNVGAIVDTYTQQDGIGGEYTYQVFKAEDGTIWVPHNDGFSIIKEDGNIENISEINGKDLGYIYYILQDNDGLMWIGTESNGIYWYDGEEYTHITKRNGLNSNYIYRLIKDQEGTIWMATEGNGVSIFKDKEFKIYDTSTSFDASSVYSALKAEDGTLWFGTETGLVSEKDGVFNTVKIEHELYNDSEVWDLEELPNGNLLMLTYDYEILEFDGQRFQKPAFYDDVYPYYVSDIMVDDDGTIWLAAYEALIEIKNGEMEVHETPSEEYLQLQLVALFKDSRGLLWIGTGGGIATFENDVFNYLSDNEGFISKNVHEIAEDRNGDIWIVSEEGVSVLKGINENGFPSEIQPFPTTQLYNDDIVFLLFDENNGLWQGTNAGLNYYDVNEWKSSGELNHLHFPLSEYGSGVEFNGWARIMDEEGTLWFGTATHGLVSYTFPENKTTVIREDAPVVFLREVRADENIIYDQLSADMGDTDLEIDFSQNNISVKINGIDYKDPSRISYRYMLKGVDSDWVQLPDIQELKYTNLSSGDYSLLVSAKSTRSDWSAPVNLFNLSVAKPFWERAWFYLSILAVLIGIMSLYIKLRVSSLEKKKLKFLVDEQTKDLQLAVDEKEVLIKEIHHRVKNNLAVVSGLLELQSWSLPEGIAKSAMQESKLRVMAMSKVHENLYQNKDLARVNFNRFLNDLVKSVAATMKRPDQNIDINVQADTVLIDVNIGIPMGLMVNEMVSNCFKHAFKNKKEGIIKIRFDEKASGYQLCVEDNGEGSKENLLEMKTKSLGVTLIKSLSSQINATLDFENKEGTRYNVFIPKTNTN